MLRILTITLMLSTTPIFAEVYKWTDEQGRVHYSDQPHNQSASSVTLPQSTTKTDIGENRSEKRQKLLQAIEEDRQEKQEKQRKQKEQASYRRKKCNYLRDKLRHMNRASGVYRLNKQGEREFLSKEQRSKSVARLKKQISKVCR